MMLLHYKGVLKILKTFRPKSKERLFRKTQRENGLEMSLVWVKIIDITSSENFFSFLKFALNLESVIHYHISQREALVENFPTAPLPVWESTLVC